jgi:flagellar hook protein FlgE
MVVTLDFSQITGISKTSNLNLTNQDGSSLGTLTSYVIDDKGIVHGTFDNGIVRTLGQVATAQFTNPQGLNQAGDNDFSQGINSGPAQIAAPGTGGSGTLRAGALEQSNADLGKNLVDLVTASAAYQGNARVINSNEQFFNELLSMRK